uniref:Uncharacterized protein n=1 Tax=Arundo donax TaxID=35708 RepID=A0A0A9HGA0_ARUDO
MLTSLLIRFFCNVKLNHTVKIAASNFQTGKSNRAELQTINQCCSLNNNALSSDQKVSLQWQDPTLM